MRQILAFVCLGTIVTVSGGCALWPQSRESGSRVQVHPSLAVNASRHNTPGEWQLGAGDALGRAVFEHYVALARARNTHPHIAGAERTNSIQP